MALRYNLLVEKPVQEEFEYIFEEQNRNTPASLYIKGPYMMAEGINKNNRIYPLDEMITEIERYTEEMIKTQRSMGELNHPATAEVDLERACHMITEITRDGNIFYGKSKVLSTPCGTIVRCLINDGVKVGMSSRALGTLEEGKTFNKVRNIKLVAVDCVSDPSYGSAYVNGILESKQYILATDGGRYEEIYSKFEKGISSIPKHNADVYLKEQIIKFINSL